MPALSCSPAPLVPPFANALPKQATGSWAEVSGDENRSEHCNCAVQLSHAVFYTCLRNMSHECHGSVQMRAHAAESRGHFHVACCHAEPLRRQVSGQTRRRSCGHEVASSTGSNARHHRGAPRRTKVLYNRKATSTCTYLCMQACVCGCIVTYRY